MYCLCCFCAATGKVSSCDSSCPTKPKKKKLDKPSLAIKLIFLCVFFIFFLSPSVTFSLNIFY